MLVLRSGAASDAGPHRDHNEDSLLVTESFFAVADGMGGHAAGEVASAVAVNRLAELACLQTRTAEDVHTAIGSINELILRAADADPARAGMGTTVSGIGVVHLGGAAHWAVFNVGDSRVYRYAGGSLSLLTVDHSEVAEMQMAGQLTADQARCHPRRNVVTRSLGTLPAPSADVWIFPIVLGERFIVCSDGLNEELTDDEIDEVLRRRLPAQPAADALVAAALTAGGHDNVTVVVIDASTDGLVPGATTTAPRPRLDGDRL